MIDQRVTKVEKLLTDALAEVERLLSDWPHSPVDFTNPKELNVFAAKLREMLKSLDTGTVVPILGLWRIMETWPYQNELRKKIVEAEYEYERLDK